MVGVYNRFVFSVIGMIYTHLYITHLDWYAFDVISHGLVESYICSSLAQT